MSAPLNYALAIRTVRAARGMMQHHLAAATGFTPSYVSLLEDGKRSPSIDTLRRLSSALRVSATALTMLAEGKPVRLCLTDDEVIR